MWAILPLVDGQLELGRDSLSELVQDGRISRRHASVIFNAGGFIVTDHSSLNGIRVDGRVAPPHGSQTMERCLSLGDTLFLAISDVRPLQHARPTLAGGRVMGPRMLARYLEVARLASSGKTLHIHGESGSGKEDAAHAFHRACSAGAGPFIAVNCATIPESLAERLLFGARRGAFSGADADVSGYVQAAHGGTLFLDEVAELQAAVQAKLLRVIENHEVLPVGAVKPVPVDLRICSASHAPLRAQVAAGRLREDLYYRLGRPEVTIPPLRERPEEIPWFIHWVLDKHKYTQPPHLSLVEECLVRHWPGNVRELITEVVAAAQAAIATSSPRIEAHHLSASAGQAIKASVEDAKRFITESPQVLGKAAPPRPSSSVPRSHTEAQRTDIEDLLRQTGGNISRAARALGIHRNSLRRLLKHHNLDPQQIRNLIPHRDETDS